MRSVWLVQVQCVTWRKTAAMRLAHRRWAALQCPGAWTAFMELLKQASCSVLFLIGGLILPTRKKKKRKKAFLSGLPPTVSRRGERRVRFFFLRGISSTDASPLSEAALIGFPYKYQSRQLGFLECVSLCICQTDTVWKRNDQIKWDGGGSGQSQSATGDDPELTVLYRDGPSEDFSHRAGNVVLPSFLVTSCLIYVSKQWRERLGHNYLTQSSPNEDVHIVSLHSGRFLRRVLKLSYAFLC